MFLINEVFYNLKCNLYSPKLGFLFYFPSIERTFITGWVYLFTANYLSLSSLSWPDFYYFRFSCVSSICNSELCFLSESSIALSGSVTYYTHQVSIIIFLNFVFVLFPPNSCGVVLSCHNNSSDPHLNRDSLPENCLQIVLFFESVLLLFNIFVLAV